MSATNTGISWTDTTWNPTTGCSHVSPGCVNCYAEQLSRRFKRTTKPWTAQNAPENVQTHADRLTEPFAWRKPRRVFVDSMSDLFHEQIPDDFIAEVFAIMGLASWHTFQVLTKRPERMAALLSSVAFRELMSYHTFSWTDIADDAAQRAGLVDPLNRLTTDWRAQEHATLPLRNVWLGVSVEDQRRAEERIPILLDTPAAVRFLSCEPLLGPLELFAFFDSPLRNESLTALGHGSPVPGIDWIIAGGESGPKRRTMELDWARSLMVQCASAGVPFFFKQISALRPGTDGPSDLMVREFPDAA